MKLENKILQLPHATVIFTNYLSVATGKKMPKLYVQAHDAYGYQREWTLQFRCEPGDSKKLFWESHVYMHPGRREIVPVGKAMAETCILKFLHLCENYSDLLFPADDHPKLIRCSGFVHFAEQLHRGALPSATLL